MDFKSDMQARIQEIEAALQTYIPKQEAFLKQWATAFLLAANVCAP